MHAHLIAILLAALPIPGARHLAPSSSLATWIPFATQGCVASGAAVGTKGETITVSRSTSRSCLVNGSYATCTANQACVDAGGLLVENTRTNYALQSDELTAAAGWTIVAMNVDGSNAASYGNGNTMEHFTATGAGCNAFRNAGAPLTAGPYVASGWARSDSGTQTHTILVSCSGGAASTATAWRSDGGTCTTGTASTIGYAQCAIGTTPVRISVAVTCAATLTQQPTFGIHPGTQASCLSGTGVGYYGGMQLEAGSFPTSYMPTTTTTFTRNMDVVSVSSTAVGLTDTEACVETEFTCDASYVSSERVIGGLSPGSPIGIQSSAAVNVYDVSSATSVVVATPLVAGTYYRVRSSWGPAGISVYSATSGLTTSTTYDGTMIGSSTYLGSSGVNQGLDGHLRNVKFYRKQTCR